MNIKGRASQGLLGEFNNALGRAFEQEVQERLNLILDDVADELADMMIAEAEELEQKHKQELRVLAGMAELAEDLATAVIESQVKELTELEATLEEAEARIDRLAADKRDLMERIHELEMENQRLMEHCQKVEVESIFAQLDAAAAKKADTKKADETKPTPKAADPKAYESIDSLLKFLFGDEEDK